MEHVRGANAALGETLTELSAIIGAPLALNSPDMQPVASMPHEGPLDGSRLALLLGRPVDSSVRDLLASRAGIFTGTQPQRIAPFPGLELGRVHLPIRSAAGDLVGHLWAIDRAEAIPESEWRRLQGAAAEALDGVALGDGTPGTYGDSAMHEFALRHPAFRILSVAAHAEPLQDPAGASVTPLAGSVRDLLAAALRDSQWIVTQNDEGEALIVGGGGPDALGRQTLESTLHQLVRRLNKDDAIFGTVEVFSSPLLFGPDELADHLQAVARVALATAGPDSSVRLAEDIPAYELLVELGRIATIDRLDVPPGIARLLDSERGRTIARTAKAFLDSGGNAGSTAATLGIHRGTLYYRITQIEEATHFELDRGDHRVALHLGLTAAQVHGLL